MATIRKAYFALLNELRLGLASRVDLVMADAVRNPYVKQSIEASRQHLEAAAAIQDATRPTARRLRRSDRGTRQGDRCGSPAPPRRSGR
jgi:hypothetical protein